MVKGGGKKKRPKEKKKKVKIKKLLHLPEKIGSWCLKNLSLTVTKCSVYGSTSNEHKLKERMGLKAYFSS